MLCDDDAVAVISELLSGICGINFEVLNTLDFLYNLYLAGQISAIMIQWMVFFPERI
ncbi:MAG: hypothetical protein ACE5J9_09660 [Methanosarcinales archaeon]